MKHQAPLDDYALDAARRQQARAAFLAEEIASLTPMRRILVGADDMNPPTSTHQ